MGDNREFERFGLEVPARITISDAGERCTPISLTTDNLSAGGIFVKMPPSLQAGTPVKVEILFAFEELKNPQDPDGSLLIVVSGYVQRSSPEGTAISFNEDYEILTVSNISGEMPAAVDHAVTSPPPIP